MTSFVKEKVDYIEILLRALGRKTGDEEIGPAAPAGGKGPLAPAREVKAPELDALDEVPFEARLAAIQLHGAKTGGRSA